MKQNLEKNLFLYLEKYQVRYAIAPNLVVSNNDL